MILENRIILVGSNSKYSFTGIGTVKRPRD